MLMIVKPKSFKEQICIISEDTLVLTKCKQSHMVFTFKANNVSVKNK